MSAKPTHVIIGRITKPHGVRGALKVEPITDDPQRFERLDKVFIGPEDNPVDVVGIKNVQFQNKFIILTLEGVDSRDDAERLRGQYLYVPFDEAITLPADSVFIFQLIGLDVYTNRNEYVGQVQDVLDFPSGHMIVVKQKDKEYLIPDVPDIVEHVLVQDGKIIINPIEGLLD